MELAQISKINQRRWRQHARDQERQNPVLVGLRYVRLFELESVNTYAQAADILGVSRQRVHQMVALVTKLPEEIRDFLLQTSDPAVFRTFTERRLRPLTQLTSHEEKIHKFAAILNGTDRAAISVPEDDCAGKRLVAIPGNAIVFSVAEVSPAVMPTDPWRRPAPRAQP